MKLLFCDMDGTLVDEYNMIHPRNIEALRAWQTQGNKLVICTGRNKIESQGVLNKYNVPYDYLILNNGGSILDRETVLYECTIAHEIGVSILDLSTSIEGMYSYFYDGNKSYAYMNEKTYIYDGFKNIEIDQDFIELYQNTKSFQIICFNQEDHEMYNSYYCIDQIMKHNQSEIEIHINQYYVDIVPPSCSKGTGIEKLLEILALPVDQIYAIGDSYNDISMFKKADISCSFTYSEPEVQEYTTQVVDYLYEFIEEGEKNGMER